MSQQAALQMDHVLHCPLPVPALLFSLQGLDHHSLKVKLTEGCRAFLLWWQRGSEDQNIGKWVGERKWQEYPSYETCGNVTVGTTQRCNKDGPGWNEFILTAFDKPCSSKLRILNLGPNYLWNIPRTKHKKDWSFTGIPAHGARIWPLVGELRFYIAAAQGKAPILCIYTS